MHSVADDTVAGQPGLGRILEGRSVAHNLVAELLWAEPREGDKPFSLHVLGRESRFRDIGREVETEVFSESFGLSAEEVENQYGRYDAASEFIVLIDRQRCCAAGAIRLVRWSEAGLPTFVDMSALPHWGATLEDAYDFHGWNDRLEQVGDVATLAVRAPYRGSSVVSAAIYHGLYWHSLRANLTRWFVMLDDAVYGLFQALGMPWEPICALPAGPHAGSDRTTPLTMKISEASEALRQKSSEGRRLLIDGVGIHEMVALPPIVLAEIETALVAA